MTPQETSLIAKFPKLGAFTISSEDILFPRDFMYGKNEDFLKVFVLSYVKFLSDSPLETRDSFKPKRVYKKFLHMLINEPILGTIKRFSALSDEILRTSYSPGDGSSIRPFVAAMKDTPIFKEYLEWQRTGRPDVGKYVLSFLRFGKKLEYDDPTFNTTAFREWEKVEDGLRNLEFDDKDTASLRTIVKALIGRLDIDVLLPKFGSGKVSERHIEDVYDKMEYLSTSPRLDYAFGKPRAFRGAEEGFGSDKLPIRWNGSSRQVSRLKFVPKDISKSRSICMEPNSFMYFQQEVLRWVRRSFDGNPIHRFVNLSDQGRNQYAAIHGSFYHSCDTIDLSSASDSVHAELVRRIFPRDWLFYLLATRTSLVEVPDGSVRRVEKFAPMGSALCFPVQCVIFTAVCIYCYDAYLHGTTSGGRSVTERDVAQLLDDSLVSHSPKSPLGKRLESPLVYGDDIIVDSRLTGDVISTLERLGFRVNVAKSFTNVQSFRESCGVYAYEGEDVTPVIFRLPFLGRSLDAKSYSSLIENINNFKKAGYYNVATFWLSVLRCKLGPYWADYIPYVLNDSDFGILVARKKAISTKRLRYNADWQVLEERVLVLVARKVKRSRPQNHDNYTYYQWWRSRTGDGPLLTETRSSPVRPQETRVAPRWARCEQ